ncbi:MAG: hypothetical protein NC818_00165 [Candidatus Omnitrophica bacterium]|nr:hypothetical protein [Candidatus Omnitrophota bacterium]
MKIVGFGYHLSHRKIKEYQKMPLEKRLLWLYQGNLLRRAYPKRIIKMQDKFRKGEIS